MAEIKNVTIINENTIRLETDASKGDTINLLDISKIDNSIIKKKIEEAKNEEIKKQLNEQKKQLEELKQKDLEVQKIQIELSFKEKINEFEKTINQLKLEKESIEKNKNLEIENAKNKVIQENKDKEIGLNKIIADLENKVNEITKSSQEKLELELLKQEKDFIDKLNKQKDELNNLLKEKDQKISKLELSKNSLNVKKVGEQLELWCNNEYESYAQCGFETCTWEKDNTVVKEDGEGKGTKADYIFKVYATNKFSNDELLTSVICEMKNEYFSSKTKKKNSDYYNKLDIDRRKKQCEYALLVSELEWEQVNDVPIRKINGYEKMYMVRPQYFISFLTIVTSLGLKFKDVLLESAKVKKEFKDREDILELFENFKNYLFDKPIKTLNEDLNSIVKEANKINGSAEKIISYANKLITKTLEDIKKEIDNFEIENICKKIDDLK